MKKNTINTIPEALTSYREKKEEPMNKKTYAGKYRVRPEATKRTKLQTLPDTKLEFQSKMHSPRINVS